MGAADIVIKQMLTPPKGANPDRIEKEKEDIRNELNNFDSLASAFGDIQRYGTPLEKLSGQGRIQGIVSALTGKMTGANPAIDSYKKARAESAASLMRVMMPGARSGQLLNEAIEWLPSEGSNWQEFQLAAHKAANAAFGRRSAQQGSPFDMQEVQNYVNSMLARHMPPDERKKMLQMQLQQPAPLVPPSFGQSGQAVSQSPLTEESQ